MREPPLIAPPVFCRASIEMIDEPLSGDKPGTEMALVIAAPVPIRVPLTKEEACRTIRAMCSMLTPPAIFTGVPAP